MTIFVYSHNTHEGSPTPPGKEDLPSAFHTDGAPIRYFSDENEERNIDCAQRPQFSRLLDAITERDTLVTSRLDDFGNDAQEIRATISLVLKRVARLFVQQIGDVDLASISGRFVLNTVDALAEDKHQHLPRTTRNHTTRTGRRNVEVPRRMRAAIVTDYSLGESISSLARRYNLPRTTVMKMVRPALPDEPSLPMAFGD